VKLGKGTLFYFLTLSLNDIELTRLFLSSPVAFERDTADPFGVDAFLESAKAGPSGSGQQEKKRGLDLVGETKNDEARKRARE